MWKIVLTILGLLYVLSPFDVLPDWFVGWGWLDDGVIAVLIGRFLYERFMKSGSIHAAGGGRGRPENENSSNEPRDREETQSQENTENLDPYQILSVNREASLEEIKKAYLRLANQYHPDKVTHLGKEFRELAETKFKKIQQAYQDLKEERDM